MGCRRHRSLRRLRRPGRAAARSTATPGWTHPTWSRIRWRCSGAGCTTRSTRGCTSPTRWWCPPSPPRAGPPPGWCCSRVSTSAVRLLHQLESRKGAELDDVAAELRATARRSRRTPSGWPRWGSGAALLRELRRKYGDTLADVIAFHARGRRAPGRARGLRGPGRGARGRAGAGGARRGGGGRPRRWRPAVARRRRSWRAAVAAHLRELAMPGRGSRSRWATVDPGDDVAFLLGANPGEPALPLAKVASGGELARTMLALRLVLTRRRPARSCSTRSTRASAARRRWPSAGRWPRSARRHQVLVVTHLPQVAAFADAQVAVSKADRGGRTVGRGRGASTARTGCRELSRMLSGLQRAAGHARRHAEELLAHAAERAEADDGRPASTELDEIVGRRPASTGARRT